MYIQVKNDPESPVLISRKLFKTLNFKGKGPWFIQLTRIRGTDNFIIVKRSPSDTFLTQCSMVTPTSDINRRTPALFHWTLPSLHYFLAVTGIKIIGSKILKVKPIIINQITYYKICTD